MTAVVNTLWKKMTNANLVEGDEPEFDIINSPWYVKTLLAISGWLGAIFLLGFIFVWFSSLLDEPFVIFFLSFPLFICAYFILLIPKNEFFEHFAVAVSLAGQALIFWSLVELQSMSQAWLTFGIIQVLLVCFMASFLHRVFSTVLAALAFELSLTAIGAPYFLGSLLIFPTVWFCLHEFSFVSHYKRINGLMYGLVIATLLLNGNHHLGLNLMSFLSLTAENIITVPQRVIFMTFIFASFFTARQLLLAYDIRLKTKLSVAVLSFSLILAITTLKAPGILVGLIVILLGFAHSNRVLLGVGVLSLLLYSSSYYSMMEDTLLFKSVVLFAVAVFMLICRILLIRFSPLLKEK